MNKLELQEQRLALQEELTNLIGQAESRALEENENSRLAEIRSEIDNIDEQIRSIDAENENIAKNNKPKETRKMAKTRLIDLINAVVEGRAFDADVQAEMAEARAEFAKSGISPKGQILLRSISATTDASGGYDVAKELQPLEVAVRNNLVASKMGADWLGGLRGDVSIPKYSGSEVKWKGEVASADDGAGTFSEIVLTPHRLTAVIDISKQMLLQASDDIEGIIINDLGKAIAEKLDSTIFSASSGDTNTPAGIFSTTATTTGSTDISAVTYDNVLALEEKVELANGSDYMFVVNPKVKFAFKGVQMASGLQMVVDGNELDGYKYISSNSVVEKGIACLDPKMLVIGQWGPAADITVDPYSKAADGQVRLVVNAYYDAKLRGDMIATEIFG